MYTAELARLSLKILKTAMNDHSVRGTAIQCFYPKISKINIMILILKITLCTKKLTSENTSNLANLTFIFVTRLFFHNLLYFFL